MSRKSPAPLEGGVEGWAGVVSVQPVKGTLMIIASFGAALPRRSDKAPPFSEAAEARKATPVLLGLRASSGVAQVPLSLYAGTCVKRTWWTLGPLVAMATALCSLEERAECSSNELNSSLFLVLATPGWRKRALLLGEAPPTRPFNQSSCRLDG